MLAGMGAALTVVACGDQPRAPSISATKASLAICQTAVRCECAPILNAYGFVAPLNCAGWTLADLVPSDSAGDQGGDLGGEFGDLEGNDIGGDDTLGGDVTIVFDQACADRKAAALSAVSCGSAGPLLGCADDCKLYYGSRFQFQPCESDDECAQGLLCTNSECRDACYVPPPVEDDDDTGDDDGGGGFGVGEACMGHDECLTGFCPAGFCAELPGDGAPCSDDGECRAGVLCVPSEVSPNGICMLVPPGCNALISIAEELGFG